MPEEIKPAENPNPPKPAADWQSLIVKGLEAPPVNPEPERVTNTKNPPMISFGEMAKHLAESPKPAPPADVPPAKTGDTSPGDSPPKAGDAPKPSGDTSPAPKPKVEVTKLPSLEQQVQDIIAKTAQTPAKEPVPEPKPEPSSDEQYEATLDDVAREELSLARFASKSNPDRYKDMPVKLIAFYKELDTYVQNAQREQPDRTLDGDDEEFVKWVEAHKPEYEGNDKRKLERQQIIEEAETRAEERSRKAEERIANEVKALRVAPMIEQAANQFVNRVAARMAPDEKSPFSAVAKIVVEKGWDAALAEDPGTAEIVKVHTETGKALLKEYLELALGVKPVAQFNPDKPPGDPENQRAMTDTNLIRFIDAQESEFHQKGGDMRTVNGRTFVPRAEFNKLSETDRGKHWTLSLDDVADILAIWSSQAAQAAHAAEIKRLERMGYVKATKKQDTKTETSGAPAASSATVSPKATGAPASTSPSATPNDGAASPMQAFLMKTHGFK